MARRDAIAYPVDQIRQWIAEGKTQAWIASELQKTVDQRVTARLIYKVCKKHEIKCQKVGPRPGPGSYHRWKGGRIVEKKSGAILVYCPGHPYGRRPGKKYVYEHRLVMEKHLGRYLHPKEVVHHKNKNPADNRIENLVLFDRNSSHLKHELTGKIPNWTEDGKRRIAAALVKSAHIRRKWNGTHHQLEFDGI